MTMILFHRNDPRPGSSAEWVLVSRRQPAFLFGKLNDGSVEVTATLRTTCGSGCAQACAGALFTFERAARVL